MTKAERRDAYMEAQMAITALMRDANTNGSKKWTEAAREAINCAFGYEISAGNVEFTEVANANKG